MPETASTKNLGTSIVPTLPSLDLSVPDQAVEFLVATQTWREEFKRAESAARLTLRQEADRVGKRQFDLDGHQVTVEYAGWDRSYDVQKLHDGLEQAGLSKERLSELITWEPRVNGVIIRQLERTLAYKVAIDEATQGMKEKYRRVQID